MHFLYNSFLKIHTLSIDTALGACAGSLFIAKLLKVTLPIIDVTLLFLCTLIIYLFDHLIDASTIKSDALTLRHRFFQTYHRSLKIIALTLSLLAIILLPFLSVNILITGSAICAFVVIYFFILYWQKPKQIYFKEVMIAFIYCVGIFCSPVVHSIYQISIPFILLFCHFLMMAMSNLILFAYFEHHIDTAENHPSIVRYIGRKKSFTIAIFFSLLLIVLDIVIGLLFSNILAFIILVMMPLSIFFILSFKDFFKKNGLYRLIGDGIFILPIIYLFIYGL